MQCNRSFCGNGFTNVPQLPVYRSPSQCNQNIYSEIVGEGEVTSLTLPDGTVQFFFMPTVKWWSTGPVQCQSTYPTSVNPMFANMNYSNPCNNNWCIRGIPNLNDQPKSCFASECNMNIVNTGYHVKFHNDNSSSTTDLHYFYPSLRQGVLRSCKDAAAVPMNTVPANNTICHYEVVCSKPCNCSARPMSLESLVDTKLPAQSTSASTNCSSDDLIKDKDIKQKKRKGKKKKGKSNNTCACACESKDKSKSEDKSITTYTDQCISCTPKDGRQTQTRKNEKTNWFKFTRKTSDEKPKQEAHKLLITDSIYQRCDGNDAEVWKPVTPLSKKTMEDKCSEILLLKSSCCSTCCSSCSNSCVNK
ncbi:uncharacterized protein LOC110384319 isoform X1 [Helicoverpa armigera]|uniref:uncharacterized protein LOC110384319 isoform X1 n=1 Tax=Helicoverpa armigera TaxID=29058 RepID=UPI0030826C3C